MANADSIIWGLLGGLAALNLAEETLSLSLPGWLDSFVELPMDTVMLALAVLGWLL